MKAAIVYDAKPRLVVSHSPLPSFRILMLVLSYVYRVLLPNRFSVSIFINVLEHTRFVQIVSGLEL